MSIEIPKRLEETVYIFLNIKYGHITVHSSDVSEYFEGSILLRTLDIACDLPEIDITGKVIDSLKKQKQKIEAETHIKLTEIDQKIQSLLAIEYIAEAKS